MARPPRLVSRPAGSWSTEVFSEERFGTSRKKRPEEHPNNGHGQKMTRTRLLWVISHMTTYYEVFTAGRADRPALPRPPDPDTPSIPQTTLGAVLCGHGAVLPRLTGRPGWRLGAVAMTSQISVNGPTFASQHAAAWCAKCVCVLQWNGVFSTWRAESRLNGLSYQDALDGFRRSLRAGSAVRQR